MSNDERESHDVTRSAVAAQAVFSELAYWYPLEGIKNLDSHAGDLADKALASADVWDEAHGVRRISVDRIQNLARRLMDADIGVSLEILNALACGNLAALHEAKK